MPRLGDLFAPRDRAYFELFEEAGKNAVLAADLLERMLTNFPDSGELAGAIRDCEHEGDRITHDIIDRLNHTFVTPIDREDILGLASGLDDIVDYTEEVADYLGLYRIEAPMDQAISLAQVLSAACHEINDAIPLLRGFRDMSQHTVEVNRLENEGDRLTREAVASLFDNRVDPMVVIRWKDLFERLESAIDSTEHVAYILEGIVIKTLSGRVSLLARRLHWCSLPAVERMERPTGLSVRDVAVSFGGITALESVSVDVSPGEVLGVIGPNGAGKTTLFNVICGFVSPDSGTLRWRGDSMARVHPDRLASLGIARTLQGVGLFTGLTVLENVMTGAQRFRRTPLISAMLGLPWSDRDERRLRDRSMAALARLGCQDVADRLPGTLPYAVQKRVAMARALVGEPELLLLDEPAGGLDARELADLGELIGSLGSSVAVMLVDHHMDFVVSVCDRLVVLDFGRVIADGEPSVIQHNPHVLEAYLGREAADAGALSANGGADARRLRS